MATNPEQDQAAAVEAVYEAAARMNEALGKAYEAGAAMRLGIIGRLQGAQFNQNQQLVYVEYSGPLVSPVGPRP